VKTAESAFPDVPFRRPIYQPKCRRIRVISPGKRVSDSKTHITRPRAHAAGYPYKGGVHRRRRIFQEAHSVFSPGGVRRSIGRSGQGLDTALSVVTGAILPSTAGGGNQFIFFGELGQNRSNSLKNAPTERRKNTFS
jgi:hypothetical protein